MAAKQNEMAYTALNIGIVAAILVGLYFLYKWIKNHLPGGNGGNLFGGPGKEQTYGNGNGPHNAGSGDLLTRLADKAKTDLKSVPHNLIVAIQLKNANAQAAKFGNKQGTNIVINKALKAVNALSDTNFLIAIKEWQALDNVKEVYDSPLALNVTSTATSSIFLSRYGQLTGRITPNAPYSVTVAK